jgi:hypothetical protein
VSSPEAGPKPLRHTVEVTHQVRTSSVGISRCATPELTLTVGKPAEGYVGDPIILRLTLCNKGAAESRHVVLNTLLPAGLAHSKGTDLESDLGALEPGDTRTLPLEVTPGRPGEMTARITVKAEGITPLVQEVSLVVQSHQLTVVGKGPLLLSPNTTGLYELAIRNDGPAVASQVSLLVVLAEGFTFGRVSEQGTYDPQTHTLLWNLGDLQPGEARSFAWDGVVRKAGTLEYRVRLKAGAQTLQEMTWTSQVVAGKGASVAKGPREE